MSHPPAAVYAPLRFSLAIKLLLTAMFWGGAFIAGKVVAQALPNLTAASLRFLMASVLLLIVVRRHEGSLPRLTAAQIGWTAMAGLVGIFIYSLCFFKALTLIPAGRTALFISVYPAVTSLAAWACFKEQLSLKRWLGIAAALIGTGIVVTRGSLVDAVHDIGQSFGSGEAVMTLAVCCWSAYTLIAQKLMTSLTPLVTTTYSILWGTLLLGLGALPELPTVHWAALGWTVWLSLLYLSAISIVVCLLWYYEGVHTIGSSRTSVFSNLVPVFGVVLSGMILHEPILISMIIGGAITLVGVFMTNRST